MNITLQPACLRWARERAGLTIPELAEKIGLKEDKVVAWEQSGEITLSRAEKLARFTHTPLGFLFLPEPPVEELPISDFRTQQAYEDWGPSIDLLDVINDALQIQDWYRDYLLSVGGQPLEFVGSLKVSKSRRSIANAAKHIRDAIGWNAEISAQTSSWETALARHIEAVEDAGILVMRSGIVGTNTHRPLSVSEFRGFALSDPYAPLIFINGKDANAAKLFTLAHELVHIALGVSGVSNLYRTYSPNIAEEIFCNAVAAELLVPLADLAALTANAESPTEVIPLATRHFKVSSLVILRRLRDAGILPDEEFERLYTDELGQFAQRTPPKGEGGGDFYATTRARLGKRFLSALLGDTLEGRTTYREALQLLGVSKIETLRNLASEMGVTSQWLTS